jgi:hypothetical protein
MAMLQHETILPMNFMQGLAGHHALKDSIERFDGTNIRFRFRSKWAWYLKQEQNTNVSRPSNGDEFKQELSDNDKALMLLIQNSIDDCETDDCAEDFEEPSNKRQHINNNDELQEQEKCHQRKLDWMIQVQ